MWRLYILLVGLRYFAIAIAVIVVTGVSVHGASAVSEKCDTETRALNNNTALQDLAPVLQCNINFDISDTCTVDYETVSMNFSTACINAGGQYYANDIFLNCTVRLGGTTYNGKSYYQNTPSCIGSSCSEDEVEMEFETNLYPKLEEYYSSRGAQCEISSSSLLLPKPNLAQSLLVLAVTTVLLSC